MTQSRIVLITGATDGLGRALAHRLAADGDTVLLHGRDQARLDATADAIRDTHGVARPATFRADLSELAQVRSLAAADAKGGGHRYALADFGLTGAEVDERFAGIPGYEPSKR